MEKTITIKGKEINFKTDGAFPRFYRFLHKRDIFADMQNLNGEDFLANGGVEVMENVAYAMARYGNTKMTETIEEWLSQFETFDLVNALPDIMSLWSEEVATSSTAKKKNEQ